MTPSTTSLNWLSLSLISIDIIFLILLPFSLHRLYQSQVKVFTSWHSRAKSYLAPSIPIVLLVNLVNALQTQPANSGLWPIVVVLFQFIASAGVCWLSFIQHPRSVRPSGLISSYVLASIIGNMLWISAPYPLEHSLSKGFTYLIAAQVILKTSFLALECYGKGSVLYPQYQDFSAEETTGLLSRVFFWWINPLLARGARTSFQPNDLPTMPQSLHSDALRQSILRAWDQRAKPEQKSTLPFVLLRCLASPLKSAIIPRLFLVIFRYGQPLLIRQLIRFVSQPPGRSDERLQGFWILVAACFVYVGLAISTAVYRHRLSALRVMTRGALVTLIYSNLLGTRSGAYDNGSAVTLMSTDCDSISGVPEMFHELWAYILEVVVGMIILSREVKWLWVVPLGLIFLCSRVSRYVAQNLRSRQKNWANATQDRIAATSCMLGSMKSVKALGLSESTASQITDLRTYEIARAGTIRWMMVVYNASANVLGIFTPTLTIVLLSVLASRGLTGPLDAETVFTTVAVLVMVTHPANMVMTIVPRAIACLAHFERIQKYLLESTGTDPRKVTMEGVTDLSPRGLAIRLRHVTTGVRRGNVPVLEGIDLEIDHQRLVICHGAVGSGKSILARVILGEIPLIDGTVEVFSQCIGYCAQTPWLPEGTVRDVICASTSEVDLIRYKQAVHSCCLDHDISSFSDGDKTLIGSRGISLSGGQRQRLALARVVYARCNIVVLDDSFSALDSKTRSQVIQNLLGPDGILRRDDNTVLWLSNNAQYFYLADQIIGLEDSQLLLHASETSNNADPGSTKLQITTDTVQNTTKLQAQTRAANDAAQDAKRKIGDFSLYGFYIKHAGVENFVLMMIFAASYSFYINFPQYWLKLWTEAEPTSTEFYMIGYVLLTFMAWTTTNGTAWSTYIKIASRSGIALHKLLLKAVVGAPMAYFTTTDVGVILNKFSQDIQLVDNDLPIAASGLANQAFKLLVQLSLLFSVQRPMLFSLPLCLIVVYVVQKSYLQTSRQLRYIDLESRSALFSSFLETVEGTVTIRAFGWAKQMEERNTYRLDESQRALYILLCLQRWLNLVLDLTVGGMALTAVALAVIFRSATSGGAVGVALNVVIVATTTLLRLVESWTSLEISLAAVARLKSMEENTPAEDKPWEISNPDSAWPSSGGINLHAVTASYNSSGRALHEISLQVHGGRRVVLCGRTGSGKSTLILTLLHLVEYTGSITVDGVNLAEVPRSVIRQRCFITIPQDTFLMPYVTLRSNVDPDQGVADEDIVKILDKVQLWKPLSAHHSGQDAAAVLDTNLASLPVLSGGQIQLMALARALAKNESLRLTQAYKDAVSNFRPILLLDEATSSLDPIAEAIIQDVIDEEFVAKGHTTVMVTHNPDTVASRMREGDIFVWMKDGTIEKVTTTNGFLSREESRG